MPKTMNKNIPAADTPSMEQWKALYATAAELKALAPWKIICDVNLIVIDLPSQEQPVFCSILGNGGQSFGIAVYPGYAAFDALKRLVNAGFGDPSPSVALEQRCLACNFGDREDIEPRDREVMRELGLRFRGRNQWIFFRSTKPGQFPWHLDAGEAQILFETLEQLLAICRSYLDGEVQADFEGGEFLHRWQEDGEWKNGAIPASSIQYTIAEYSFHPQDEVLYHQLRQKEKTEAVLEMEFGYLPIPFRESKNSPIIAPYLVIVFEQTSRMIVGQYVAKPNEPIEDLPSNILVGYIESNGIPASVYVRSGHHADYLKKVCGDFNIPLQAGEGMPLADEFFFMAAGDFSGDMSP